MNWIRLIGHLLKAHKEYLKLLLTDGITKPGIRLSLLHLSLNHSNPSIDLIKLLLKKGANVNQESIDKRTPLFRACQPSREDIILITIEYYSVSQGDYNIVKIIRKGGNANLRLMDDCGESLLHVAALNATPLDYAQSGYQSNLEYIEFLKSNYKNIKNGKGRKFSVLQFIISTRYRN
ncbi:hypothetical protein ACTFIW_009579 [Dictyostelium discoideum]